jgi:hypothetical protein
VYSTAGKCLGTCWLALADFDAFIRANIAEQTNFISGNVQKGYPSFQQALAAYMVKFDKGRVQAVPLPGGPFWPSPPESLPNPPSLTLSVDSSVSLDLYALWSQVEDLTEAMSQLQ